MAVRAIRRSMSRSTAWLIAPAPPAERAPPRQVRKIRLERGVAGDVHRRHRREQQQRLHLRLGQRQVVATGSSGGRHRAPRRGAVWAPLHAGSGYRLRLAAPASSAARRCGAAIASRMSRIGRGLRTSGQDVEVVRLRRREREPLERVAAPRVVAGLGAALAAGDRVDQGQDDPDRRGSGCRSRRSGCRRRRRCRRRTCRRRSPGPPRRRRGRAARRRAGCRRPSSRRRSAPGSRPSSGRSSSGTSSGAPRSRRRRRRRPARSGSRRSRRWCSSAARRRRPSSARSRPRGRSRSSRSRPSAKSSGARIRSAPPTRVAIRLKTIRPKGTISASDISIAKYIQPIPIGAVSMFCIQARVPITAIAASEPITTPRLKSGLRGEGGDDFGDRAEGEDQDQHVAAGVEDPAQVLPEQRRAAGAVGEEDAVVVAVDHQHRQRRQQDRADHQHQPGADGGGPGEDRHPPPGHARRPHRCAAWSAGRSRSGRSRGSPGRSPVAQASTPLLERKASSVSGASGLTPGLRGGEEEAGVEHGRAGDVERQTPSLAEPRQRGAAGADLQRRHVVEEPEYQRHREEEDGGRAVERRASG